MKIARLVSSLILSSLLGFLVACGVSVNADASSSSVRDRVVAAMDCEEQLADVRAVSASVPVEETYRRLDGLAMGKCSTHQGVLAERFIIGSSYRIGATPDELIRGVDWRSSTNDQLLWALSLAAIKDGLSSPKPEDVLDHFLQVAPKSFLPHLLRARLYQHRDDFVGVERELRVANELLGGRKSNLFEIERSQLAPIFFLEGRIAESYELSMDFLRLYGDEAWNSPNMIGIAAMSAIDLGKPEEALQLLEELHRRNPAGMEDPAINAARAELAFRHPEVLSQAKN